MIKRYKHDPINYHGQYPDYYSANLNPEPEDENGDWCKYADVAALQAECERLRVDAVRYQWLCEQRRWLYNKAPTPGISLRWENHINGGTKWIDEAIDSRLTKEQP